MEYTSSKQVLQSLAVKKVLPRGCEWWSKYIYHFSHVTNIASVLNDGEIKCRNLVYQEINKYGNDNASGEVINGTSNKYKDYVRFYFRPLTPTQYHNEGIRAKDEISYLEAHCPVPVFLLFDTSILDEENVYFSYESFASHYSVPEYQGIDNLSKAPFNYIYHYESTSGLNGPQIVKHRHAEVIIKDRCNLNFLQKIVCRSKPEADTLKALLNPNVLEKYRDKIVVIGEGPFDTNDLTKMFRADYLRLINVEQKRKSFKIKFSSRDNYSRKLQIYWKDENSNLICKFIDDDFKSIKANFNKEYELNLFENLKSLRIVYVEIWLDDSLVFFNKYTSK